MSEQDREKAGIATRAENEALEHTVDGITTRRDATDLGVPMIAGDPNEVQGPEDALGPGPKRGDYTQRVGPDNYHPHVVVPVADAEPGQPQVEVIAQRPFASNVGDVAGKGGVSTDEAQAVLRGGTQAAARGGPQRSGRTEGDQSSGRESTKKTP